MPPYELWLTATDNNGNLLVHQILKAARELGPNNLSYRQRDIGRESLANTIAQAAVEAASKANHGRPIENPKAYLLSVFTRKMNRFLDRQARHIALDALSNDKLNKTMKTTEDRPVERRISLIELL